ncbi:hypothetical protein H072_600 [Dactylellina haptotyla CBS 200.50]|uniref:Peptidase A1 domain-containing protein n=1 Tax=Dactylellina haptotyla (strain CBS 200.50) TaxID=1284197 RepID=S8AWS0_DACHA|nr:hypothetical protein H072_600 [Dactylellina haptotyla CBS 200.50]
MICRQQPSPSSKVIRKSQLSKASVLAIGFAVAFTPISAIVIPKIHGYPTRIEERATQVDSSDCPSITTDSFQWDSNSCSQSYFSSWAYPIGNWDDPPKVNITIAGVPITATVDTGSTGLVASMDLFPNVNFTKKVEASIAYSSSHWLEEGYEEWIDMTFGPYAMKTKILVKDKEVCCPDFNTTTDGNRCPAAKITKSCVCEKTCENDKTKRNVHADLATRAVSPLPVAYMGIGFGRGVAPISNAFLDTVSFNGQALSLTSGDYCQGYAITHDGIWLGLNSQNTKDFEWTKLQQQDVQGMRDWNTAPMEYHVNDGASTSGTLLVDTGIPNSYFSASPRWETGDSFNVTVPGTSGKYAIRYDTSEGDTSPNPMQPTKFGISSLGGYINSGRKLLNCFDVAYDPIGGNFGYRYLGNAQAAKCSEYVTVAES